MSRNNGFARHSLTHLALERLRRLELGEEVSYAELSEVLGCDVQEKDGGYQFVKSARDILRRAKIIIYPTDTKSLRRWTDQEIASWERALRDKRIRRQAKLGEQGLQAVNLNAISPEMARVVTSDLGHLGAVQVFTSTKFTEARHRGLASNSDPPPATPPDISQ